MCEDEFNRTIKFSKPDFTLKRFKYFTTNTDFLFNRVKDGNFNNSKFVKDRYRFVVSFIMSDNELSKVRINKNEIEMDRRKNITCKVLDIIEGY
jgi:hypothetical protein